MSLFAKAFTIVIVADILLKIKQAFFYYRDEM